MKTFTRINAVLTVMLAVCWASSEAQQTCATAVPLNCGDVIFGSTTGVTNDNATSGAIGNCGTSVAVGTAGQMWYTFTSPSAGNVTMSTVGGGTTFDTQIHIYTGNCGGPLACAGGNDDFTGTASQATFAMTATTTYLVRVGGWAGNFGDFQFAITCALLSDGCTNPAACNFNPQATNDDGSCCLGYCETLTITAGPFPAEIGWSLFDPTGTLLLSGSAPFSGNVCLPAADCGYTFTMTDAFGDGWNGATYTFSNATGGTDATGTLAGGGGPTTITLGLGELVSGCTDIMATNYDPGADCDDGSCITCTGGAQVYVMQMTDTFGDGWNGSNWIIMDVNFNTVATGTLATGTSGSFTECLMPGCYTMSVTAGTFPAEIGWSLTTLNGTPVISGGADENVGFAWAGETGCVINGCTDPTCNNYNQFATNDDGSCICPPANDACVNAIPIGCGQTISGTTINSNPDGTPPTCGIVITAPGVWYTFIGTGDQVTLTTCNSPAGDTKIHVFSGDCTTPVCVAANDDGCAAGFLSSVSFTSVNGVAYNILVSEFGAGIGINFNLEMICSACAGSPINDNCADALPLPTGVDFTGNLCCSNPDPEMAPWAGFGTQYGIWYVINSENFEALTINFWNGAGPGPDAGDGTDVGIGLFEGGGGCGALTALVGGVGFNGIPLDGFVFNSYEFGITLIANTDYYFCLSTSDPVGCGDFIHNVTLSNVGCTDANADNFCADCSIDDGSCTYTSGQVNDLCEDAIALDCNSTISGSTGGSTATGAPNICPAGAGDNGVWYTFVGDGQFTTISTCGSVIDSRIMLLSSANGCAGPFTCVDSEDNDATVTGCGFFNGDDASINLVTTVGTVYYVYITAGAVDTNGDNVNDLFDGAFSLSFTCAPVIQGCLNTCACNYNPAANVSNNTCDFYSCAGCAVGSSAVMMDMTDTFGDGWNGNTYSIEDATGAVVATGDLDTADCGDNLTVGSTVFCLVDGCYTMTVGGGIFQNEVVWTLRNSSGVAITNGSVGTFLFTIGAGVCGCTDVAACNYNANATSDNGSCEFTTCAGCTDNTACNFNAAATINDPTQCCFNNCVNLLMNDSFGDGWNGATASVVDQVTGLVVATAGLPAGTTGTANLCLPIGCYSIIVGGGTFDGEISWTLTGITGGVLNGNANMPNGTNFSVGGANCTPGCTNTIACNYDPTAGISDCTLCEFQSCLGCTYNIASNYDPAAVIDDGSCIITPGNTTCPWDFDGNGIVGVSDLIQFIAHYGEICE